MKRADHDMTATETNCPPAVRAAEGRCTALRAGANPTYGSRPATGKRFSRLPDNTGNNSRVGVPHGVTSPSGADDGRPEGGDDFLAWSWPKRGGEFRMVVCRFKGRDYINLRWWVAKGDDMVATQKGVMIPLEAAEDFAEAATRAAAHLQARAS